MVDTRTALRDEFAGLLAGSVVLRLDEHVPPIELEVKHLRKWIRVAVRPRHLPVCSMWVLTTHTVSNYLGQSNTSAWWRCEQASFHGVTVPLSLVSHGVCIFRSQFHRP